MKSIKSSLPVIVADRRSPILLFVLLMLFAGIVYVRIAPTPSSGENSLVHHPSDALDDDALSKTSPSKVGTDNDSVSAALAEQNNPAVDSDVINPMPPTDLVARDFGAFAGLSSELLSDDDAATSLAGLKTPFKPRGMGDAQSPANDERATGTQKRSTMTTLKLKPVEVGASRLPIVERIFRQHADELKACYQGEADEVLDDPFVVAFRFDGNGGVTAAHVSVSTSDHKRVEDCMTKAIAAWRFPADRHLVGSDISYSFAFEHGALKQDSKR